MVCRRTSMRPVYRLSGRTWKPARNSTSLRWSLYHHGWLAGEIDRMASRFQPNSHSWSLAYACRQGKGCSLSSFYWPAVDAIASDWTGCDRYTGSSNLQCGHEMCATAVGMDYKNCLLMPVRLVLHLSRTAWPVGLDEQKLPWALKWQ